MNTKHTPGPWSYRETGSSDTYAIECNLSHMKHLSTEERVARVETLNEANARLIAAGPDMLEALEFVERILNSRSGQDMGLSQAFEIVQAAIRKTRGDK